MGAVNEVQADEIIVGDVSEHSVGGEGAFELVQFFEGSEEIVDGRFRCVLGRKDVLRRFDTGGNSADEEDCAKLHFFDESGFHGLVRARAH